MDARYYALKPGPEAGTALRAVEALPGIVAGDQSCYDALLLDTYDWRLHGDNTGLLLRRSGRRSSLLIESPVGRVNELPWPSRKPPRWASDLPGPLRAVAKQVGIRALVEHARIDGLVHRFRLLNDDDKTVVRIAVETAECRFGKSEPVTLAARLVLLPVKGYDDELARLDAELHQQLPLVDIDRPRLGEALAQAGRQVDDGKVRLRATLEGSMPSADALRILLLGALDVIEHNEDGVRRDIDSECLHDFRVAVRRTRSLLDQLPGVFPAQPLEHFRNELAWLGSITGTTRDLDVYLLNFPDYLAQVPELIRGDLEPLLDFLSRRRRLERRRLVHQLRTRRYQALLRDWRSFLENPPGTAGSAGRPIMEIASERIARLYRKVRKLGRRIDAATPDAEVHRLRIACKKLRYLLEAFGGVYDAAEMKKLVRQLKRLQDDLGRFNDYAVQIASLEDYAQQMVASDPSTSRAVLAMGALVGHMAEEQARVRGHIEQRFAEYDTAANRARYARLFTSKEGEPA